VELNDAMMTTATGLRDLFAALLPVTIIARLLGYPVADLDPSARCATIYPTFNVPDPAVSGPPRSSRRTSSAID
jgi:hypothetical protein